MNFLPPLAPGAVALPLNPMSAAAIAAILLRGESASAADDWHALLSDDPVLLLWTAAHHARCGQEEPPGAAALAAWLAPKALGLLDWSSAGANAAESTLEPAAWREIVARGLACGRLADADPMRHTLAGTIEAIRAADVNLPNKALGNWLARCHTQLAASLPAAIDDDAIETDLRRLLRQWPTRDSAGDNMLPSLTARLHRLRELEADHELALRREKLAAMRELAYGASHEINNPLANISTRAQSLLREEHDPERRRMLATIHLQAIRAYEMIANLMHYAKPPRLDRQPLDLAECVAAVVDELAEWSGEQGTSVHTAFPAEPCLVAADRGQLMVALRALVRNSLEALAAGGRIDIELETLEPDDAAAEAVPQAVVCVRDNGPGIPPAALPHLFDPFFSGREAGRGLGFGLAWCERIIERHGGRIEVESREGHGAEFRVILERMPDEPL